MIRLVQYAPGRQAADVEFELLAVHIQSPCDDAHFAAHDLI